MKIPINDRFNQTQVTIYNQANNYGDLALSDNGLIYGSNIIQPPFSHVTRFDLNGQNGFFIGDDDNDGNFELDFNLDANYGKVYFDNALNKLWVTDFANIFYPDLGANGETHRMPRISAYAPDGTLLERLIPNGDPNDFFSFLQPGDFGSITSMAAGPDRFYVAENVPLHRLHVFDTSPFIPVTCNNLPEGEVCQQIGYTPANGFIGTETFTYSASDPFSSASNTATVTIHVINDTQAPILSCPASITLEKNDNAGFVANLDEPEKEPNETMRNFLLGISVSENTDLPVVEATHNIPAALPLGQTVVIYSATDGSNNTGTCQTLITVVDTTVPIMSATNDITIEATGLLTPFADIGIVAPTVTDFSSYVLSNDAPSDFAIGDTLITWVATDTQGNSSQQQQVIHVVDTTPPEFNVAANATNITNNTIFTPIAYTPPQATDVVGINSAGVVCVPKIGDLIPMGKTLVQCDVSDMYGNKSTTSFIVNYYDSDVNYDGVIDVLDVGNRQFSDAINGGMTTGSINFPENTSAWMFKVYEAPTNDTGVVISVEYTPARNNKSIKGATYAVAHACNDKVIMDKLNTDNIMFDDISVTTNDHIIVSCTPTGYKVFSQYGNNDFKLTLPDNSVATLTMEFNNGLEIDGWQATANSNNRGEIILNTPLESYQLQPGSSVNLQMSDLIFKHGFE